MSSIKMSALHNYWSTNSLMRTPFFRTYLSRNKFQDILWNFQVADAKNNLPPGSPTVMGLLQKTKLLDNDRTVLFDNYFNACELLEEMLYRDTYGAVKQEKFFPCAPVHHIFK